MVRADPRDHGNLDTRLDPCRRAGPETVEGWEALTAQPGVERVARHDGRISLRVRGLEFAELSEGGLLFGLEERHAASQWQAGEIARLAEELDRARSPESRDRLHPFTGNIRRHGWNRRCGRRFDTVDASLMSEPVYGQAPALAGGERGISTCWRWTTPAAWLSWN